MLDAKNYLGRMLAERYLLVRVIGHGASSTVFYAQDMMTRQEDGSPLPVAIKVLDRDAGEYKLNSKSYRTEISAVADIPTSPHIIAVKDVSFFEDEHFIVMEYVSGKTLKDYIAEKGGTLSPKEIVSISLQLLAALRVAHEAGVVHRDVKPQNIMVERADEVGGLVDIPGGADMPFVKLADFGIALLPDEDLFAMKEKGVGTVYYISPEQACGNPTDARSDLYSLGVVMYEMATGNVPFDAQSPTGIISKHQTEMPFHVRNRNHEIPLLLDQIIFTAMQKNPAARYKDAATMEKKLKEVMRALCHEGIDPVADEPDAFRQTPVGITVDARDAKAPRAPRAPKARLAWGKPSKGLLIGGGAILLCTALVLLGIFLLPTLLKKTYDITVPNLVGTVYSEGATYADGVFVPADKVTFAHSNTVKKGQVIGQTPSSGVVLHDVEKVEISLVVSLGPEMADFSLPAQYRTDYQTAKGYLEHADRPYLYFKVSHFVEADAYDPTLPGGTVVGAYRKHDFSPLSLDGDEVCKSLAEEIVLVVNPTEKVILSIPESALFFADRARAYIEENYSFLTVVGTETADTANMPAGTVIGLRLADGTTVAIHEKIAKKEQGVKLILAP